MVDEPGARPAGGEGQEPGPLPAGEAGPEAPDTVPGRWAPAPPLPRALANNAVAAVPMDGRLTLFSFLGLDSTRRWTGIVRDAFRWERGSGAWRRIAPVPGREGRLAATAQALRGRIYLLGGYTVGAAGDEVSLPNVDIYDPASGSWSSGAAIPVPVDDAVSGVWRDSLVYLVSGWSQRDNVADVQVYDPGRDRWSAATPIPGSPVFGHAGGIVGDAIVYCDGVRVDPSRDPRFVLTEECWRGDIDPDHPERIAWGRLPPHPGGPKYRAAAGAVPARGLVVFAGGTDNPYNYDGVGYDGRPSAPSAATFAYDVVMGRWLLGPRKARPTMDHRGLVGAGDRYYVVGGMTSGREVTAHVGELRLEPRLEREDGSDAGPPGGS